MMRGTPKARIWWCAWEKEMLRELHHPRALNDFVHPDPGRGPRSRDSSRNSQVCRLLWKESRMDSNSPRTNQWLLLRPRLNRGEAVAVWLLKLIADYQLSVLYPSQSSHFFRFPGSPQYFINIVSLWLWRWGTCAPEHMLGSKDIFMKSEKPPSILKLCCQGNI